MKPLRVTADPESVSLAATIRTAARAAIGGHAPKRRLSQTLGGGFSDD